jgi:hypothetical protein
VKRVLLIAYYFPPQPKTGSLRGSGFGYCAHVEESCMAVIRLLYARFRAVSFARDAKPQWQPFTQRELSQRFAKVLDATVGEQASGR